MMEQTSEQRCEKCDLVRPIKQFSRRPAAPAGRDSICMWCMGRIVHGHAPDNKRSPEYGAWLGMIQRCYNSKRREYENYGGRGIKVCDEWMHDFPAFLSYVGLRPSRLHSLDRWPDPNGNYAPGNVRWATLREQARNKRNTRMITAFGETRCLDEWAERYGINRETLRYRLGRMDPESALSIPVNSTVLLRAKPNNRRITAFSETRCLTEWAERYGLNPNTLRSRIMQHGWDPERALTVPIMGPVESGQAAARKHAELRSIRGAA